MKRARRQKEPDGVFGERQSVGFVALLELVRLSSGRLLRAALSGPIVLLLLTRLLPAALLSRILLPRLLILLALLLIALALLGILVRIRHLSTSLV